MKSSATIILIPELKDGPFLYSADLAESCRQAARAGFDAVELVIPSAQSIDVNALRTMLAEHRLELAAISSGGGFVIHKLHLTSPDDDVRRRAREYILGIIDLAGQFGASVIVGMIKGYLGEGVDRPTATARLTEALDLLGQRAASQGAGLLLEPLNRYESNFINRLDEGVQLIERLNTPQVKLLADLFHMNIEEDSIAGALLRAGPHIGHVHWADSNRRPPGCGHTHLDEVGQALRTIGYSRYVSAEVFPYPDPASAATQCLAAFREHLVRA